MLVLASSSWTFQPLLLENRHVLDTTLRQHTQPRLLMVTTATLAEGREVREDKPAFWTHNAGSEVHTVDLRNLTQNPLDTTDTQGPWHGVVLLGGNTFVLLESIRQLDARCLGETFSESLKRLAQQENGLVVGESAGACVLGDDIAHLRDGDDHTLAAPDLNTQGLALVTRPIVPHIGCPFYGLGEAANACRLTLQQDRPEANPLLIGEDEALVLKTPFTEPVSLKLKNGLNGIAP